MLNLQSQGANINYRPLRLPVLIFFSEITATFILNRPASGLKLNLV